ncbi:hypothetical protein [Halobacillus mangrovi]|uniref:Uncharacterized protein n=1 Tax=Halobacillus mangrovi TaxID=402384 RepID=A0A1W5ZSV9_9BACI|nr:hypothetical protein [Halobacillus mangrovi]ARI76341.1 hypothetical protein HM131_05600 [Halobacillus mangrovi]
MKKYYLFSIILAVGLLLGACGSSESQDNSDSTEQTNEQDSEATSGNADSSEGSSEETSSSDEGQETELASGIDTVIASVEDLNSSLEDSADVTTLNEKGKTLEEDWDSIEKKVEEQFPDQYEKIEKSLYPLIDEAKKDEPDVEKMKELVKPTLDSLNELKQSVGSEG